MAEQLEGNLNGWTIYLGKYAERGGVRVPKSAEQGRAPTRCSGASCLRSGLTRPSHLQVTVEPASENENENDGHDTTITPKRLGTSHETWLTDIR